MTGRAGTVPPVGHAVHGEVGAPLWGGSGLGQDLDKRYRCVRPERHGAHCSDLLTLPLHRKQADRENELPKVKVKGTSSCQAF